MANRTQTVKLRKKTGFSLLETMLAVALLLIVSLIVYQGLASTIKVSGNTALYERTGKEAASDANTILNSTSVAGYTPSSGQITMTRTDAPASAPVTLSVDKYSLSPSVPFRFSDVDVNDTSSPTSTHRQVFRYVSPTP